MRTREPLLLFPLVVAAALACHRAVADEAFEWSTALGDTPGAHWRLRAGNAGGFPGSTWLAPAGAPSAGWRAAGRRPSARATAEWALDGGVAFGLTPGLLLDRDEGGHRHASGVLAASLGKSLAPDWRGLVALSGRVGGADAPLSLDGGLAYRANDTMQLDLSLSHALGGGASGLRAGVGLAARF